MSTIDAVLFDLDGTLLDTAPDLVFALNRLRSEHDLPALPLSAVRPLVSLGSKQMIKFALNIDEHDANFAALRKRFLALYEKHLSDSTQFFPHIEEVLNYLEKQHIPWGIVTNKLTHHTMALLKALQLLHRPLCIICGDTLPKYKPDPEPILYACELLQKKPQHCLFVGDSIVDVKASKAAGTKVVVALYGYISPEEKPLAWQADGYIHEAHEILNWVKK